jgi:hypothetical protein
MLRAHVKVLFYSAAVCYRGITSLQIWYCTDVTFFCYKESNSLPEDGRSQSKQMLSILQIRTCITLPPVCVFAYN